MTPDHPTPVQHCLDRLHAGDPDARGDLLTACKERVRAIVRARMTRFPRVRRWQDSDDVLQEALIRLNRLLADPVPTTHDLLVLAARNVHWILLDHARWVDANGYVSPAPDSGPQAEPPAPSSADPAELISWAEFHERVASLPDALRAVFELHWYLGLTHVEAAAQLDVSEKTVKRRWTDARVELGKWLTADDSALE